jgi:hypothetical protein
LATAAAVDSRARAQALYWHKDLLVVIIQLFFHGNGRPRLYHITVCFAWLGLEVAFGLAALFALFFSSFRLVVATRACFAVIMHGIGVLARDTCSAVAFKESLALLAQT